MNPCVGCLLVLSHLFTVIATEKIHVDGGPGEDCMASAPNNARAGFARFGDINGFDDDVFFLRSDDDNFVLIPGGRLQLDFLAFSAGAHQVPDTFLSRRIRPELYGTFLKRFDFQFGVEAAAPGPTLTDAYVIFNAHRLARLQIGQFDGPFTMENRTSDKYTDMIERTTAVRDLAIAEMKHIGIMLWGQPEGDWAYWSVGTFNGEGTGIVPHRLPSFDLMGRAWVAPLAWLTTGTLKWIWVGASYWAGSRDWTPDQQRLRPPMTTHGGFVFFNPIQGSLRTGSYGPLHKWAVEAYAPVGPVVLKAEYVHDDEGMRELQGTRTDLQSVRMATLTGEAFYVRISWFIWGDVFINRLGGMENVPHVVGSGAPPDLHDALQWVLEYDRTAFVYTPEAGVSDFSPWAGHYVVHTLGMGLNYWATRHVRLTSDAFYYRFSGPGPKPSDVHPDSLELMLRVAVAL